jgi:hypothetical protein
VRTKYRSIAILFSRPFSQLKQNPEREREREREWHERAKSHARKRPATSKLVSPRTTSSLRSTFYVSRIRVYIFIFMIAFCLVAEKMQENEEI